MIDGYGNDHLAIAWRIPGQESVEVIPAYYSAMKRPG